MIFSVTVMRCMNGIGETLFFLVLIRLPFKNGIYNYALQFILYCTINTLSCSLCRDVSNLKFH